MKLTLAAVKKNKKIANFIKQTDRYMDALGYTDHGVRHVGVVSERSGTLAKQVGLRPHDQELSAIAGYCHDMGNFLGRSQHHYWAALLFGQVFMDVVSDIDDVSAVMQAIVSHDKDEIKIVNKITAVLILADKSDVHRSRVVEKDMKVIKADIHDRVNYSVMKSDLNVDKKKKEIILKLKLDTRITDVMEYFEIFTERMTFCRLAAKYLGYDFVLMINDFKVS